MADPRGRGGAGGALSAIHAGIHAALYTGAAGLAGAGLRLRAALGDDDWRERLGLGEPPPGAAIWLHAASVGELNSARAVIEALAQDPGLIVTTNSPTGRALARGCGLPSRLAPFDSTGPTARFLRHVRPRVQVTVEGEFWPTRARLLAEAGVPQVVIGARMSARSARRWARLAGLIGPALHRITALSAQDAASEARLVELGLRRDAVLPRLDLKLLGPAATPLAPPQPARDAVVLAASTHEGEEGPVLDAFLAARAQHPDLRLILAPRHPARGDRVAALIAARGLAFARRSAGGDETAPILLADSLGEMARWYGAAGMCITGGSFSDRGGHTPWEPAAHGCAILHGPHVSNFADSYAGLDETGAALAVSAAKLGPALARLASDPGGARAMGAAARARMMAQAGDPGPLIAHIRTLARHRRDAHI